MAEDIIFTGTKTERYEQAILAIRGLTEGEPDITANLANIAAVLKQAFDFWWVGFYLVQHNELVLGPFQGPVACTRIAYGKGVCGTSWKNKVTVIVPDVHVFPGHIACSGASNSEIVVPVIREGEVKMILDVDSEHYDHFDTDDQAFLEQLAQLITEKLPV